MRVVVAGATGAGGVPTVRALIARGHQLLVTAEIQPVEGLSGLRLRQLIAELRQRVGEESPRVSAVHLTPVVTAEDLPALTAFDADCWLRRGPDPEQA